jgi:hypothetical protein
MATGFFFDVDALFGGHLDVTLSKSKEERAAFGLHVEVEGEGYLNQWDPKEKKYLADLCPGKVDSYRFMTFYLQPKADNFDKFWEVVDTEWLNGQGQWAGQDIPKARALREARGRPNEVWRVLHRVTYVSRIPEQFGSPPQEVAPKDVRRPANVEANMGLIREIERLVPKKPPSLVQVGEAVDELLGEPLDDEEDGWSPGELEGIIPWWSGKDEGFKIDKEAIRGDLITYLKGYYEIEPSQS